jgi:CDP-glycerol glycerophosphotransferase
MRNLIKKLLPRWVLSILKQVRYLWIISLFYIFRIYPINKKRIVLCNIWGFGDNMKYVAEELARRKRELGELPKAASSYEIIYITNHPEAAHAPVEVRVLKTNAVSAIFALATARVWVDNNRKENYIRKRKGQYYIQTWHGGIALKKIERDYDKLSPNYVENAKRDSKMTDLYVSNSSFCTNLYRNSFWYSGEILECGSPRTDILLNPNPKLVSDIRLRLGVNPNTNIAIYAPTYREGIDTKSYHLDFEKLLSILENKFGGEWVIAVRLHPLVSEQSSFLTYNKHILNASHYRDLYELMAVSEVMITDYSNIMFEFSFMKKPVFLYAVDEEEYTKDRGFYFDYNELPYDRAKSQEQLFENIEQYQKETCKTRVQAFLDTLTMYETGHASKTVAERIMKVINKE